MDRGNNSFQDVERVRRAPEVSTASTVKGETERGRDSGRMAQASETSRALTLRWTQLDLSRAYATSSQPLTACAAHEVPGPVLVCPKDVERKPSLPWGAQSLTEACLPTKRGAKWSLKNKNKKEKEKENLFAFCYSKIQRNTQWALKIWAILSIKYIQSKSSGWPFPTILIFTWPLQGTRQCYMLHIHPAI